MVLLHSAATECNIASQSLLITRWCKFSHKMGNGLKIGLLDFFFSVHLNEPWNLRSSREQTFSMRRANYISLLVLLLRWTTKTTVLHLQTTQPKPWDVLECEKIRNAVSGEFIFQETWDFGWFLLIILSHCSKSSFFVQKFNFDFPRKLSIFWGEKLVKMLWFWTF